MNETFDFNKISLFKDLLDVVGKQNSEYIESVRAKYRQKEIEEFKKNGDNRPAGWMEKENPIDIIQFVDFSQYNTAHSPFHFDTLRMLYLRDKSSSIKRSPAVDPYGERSQEELAQARAREEEQMERCRLLNQHIIRTLEVNDLIDWIYFMYNKRKETGITSNFGIPFNELVPNFMFLDLRELEEDFRNSYLKKVPTAHINELTVDKKTKNFDGTYYYYINMLDELDRFILLESLIKEWSQQKHLELIFDLKIAPLKVVNKFSDYCSKHIKSQIPENEDSLSMAIAKLTEGYTRPEIPAPKKALDVSVSLFLMRVPSSYSIGRPKEFIAKYEEQKRKLNIL